MKRYFVILCITLFIIQIPLIGNKIVIHNINEEYGLSKNISNCMCVYQDSTGFLWFGMSNGLYKFDLNSFKYLGLHKNKINGFPESDVRAIIEYSPGLLLVGTYNKGLLIYNTVLEKFDSVVCKSSFDFSKQYVHCIYQEKSGIIWVGTFSGLFRLKPLGNNNFELLDRFDEKNSKLVGNEFIGITESKDGTIWFLTVSDIACYNPINHTFKSFPTWDSNSSFTFMDDKNLLIGCFGAGLKKFNIETNNTERVHVPGIDDNARVRYVFKDKNANIWLSLSNIGLLLLESGFTTTHATLISNKDYTYSNLNSNIIYQIGESKDGALWICNQEGVNMIYIKPNFFKSYSCNDIDNNSKFVTGIRALLGSENRLWIGTIGGGLKQFDLKSEIFYDVPLVVNDKSIGRNLQVIVKDHKDNYWLGTEGDGVIKFTPEKNSGFRKGTIVNYRKYPSSYPVNTLLNDYIMCILEDSKKNIWIGTWHGLSLIESSDLDKKDQSEAVIKNFLNNPADEKSISNNTIMCLLEDKKGNVWAGTQEGLNRIIKTKDGYEFKHDFKDNSGTLLSEKKIMVMHQGKDGKLWFSTQDGGISSLDIETGKVTDFNSGNGFNDNIVISILEDSLGVFWLGTNSGLCRYDPSNRSFNIYTTEDGLTSDNFFFASNCKTGDNLYFGGNNGFEFFDPLSIVPSEFQPHLVFTDFKLFNNPVYTNAKNSPIKKHISTLKSITLKYNQNYITIAFAALNYNQHQQVLYSCKMEGLETSWNKLLKEQKITYNNLMPGNYIFRVKAINSNNYNNSAEISLKIKISPPFWKTTLAYVFYFILLTFSFIQFYQFIIKREKQKNSLELERVNAKRLHEMDMLKLQFFTNISHEFRTPLTLLSAPLESLIKENPEPLKAKSYYQIMLKNVNRLTRLIDQLLDLRKIEEGHLKMEWNQGDIIDFIDKIFNSFQNYAEKRNIYFTFNSLNRQLPAYFDADKLDKVVFNLLSNAFKYTPDYGTISIKLDEIDPLSMPYKRLVEKYLEIKITDSGIGIPKGSLDEIFNPFQQVNSNKPIGSAATGIGLSLTKELINLHNGFITVESEVNKGSTFIVYLPVYKTNPQKNLNDNKNLTEIENQAIIDSHPEPSIDQNGQSIVKTSTAKPLLLIVEDNSDLRDFLKNELQIYYRIIESANGKDGLDQAIDKIPDLIISDIMMDKMDGIELCRRLKGNEHTSHIPIILLTARHSEDLKLSSYELGADDYITKPFNISLLVSRVKNLMEQRRKLRKLFGKGDNFDFSTIAINKIDTQFMEKLKLVIDKNIANSDYDPSALASDMAMSRMQLYRKVTALTNQTVYNYIRTIRLNKAAELLVTTDMQIAEVAFAVGYPEPSNFTKCFIRQFNQTPSQYARSNRR